MSKNIAILSVSILVPGISLATPSNEVLWEEIQALKNQSTKTSEQSEKSLDVSVGGFVRADVGFGKRYGDDAEKDHIGISKAALATVAKYGNNSAVLVVGTSLDSDPSESGNADGNVSVKDAFVVLDHFLMDSLKLSVGAQPLLVGLKPNGYPGDRSINTSIEYGATGTFAVSGQAAPSVIANFSLGDQHSFQFGVFDRNEKSQNTEEEGSSIGDNFFTQWRGSDIAGLGLYAALAYEVIYVGAENNKTNDIIVAGLGWKNSLLDVSFEYNKLGADIASTEEDETYMILETSANVSNDVLLYADYAVAEQRDTSTVRVGTNYNYSEHVVFSAEYAMDKFDDEDKDVESIDFRVSYNF